jgi:undecaprenyl-diphosphatase
MRMNDWLAAIILGLVEGLTEFIPVSSTGHLLLAEKALGLEGQAWAAFAVLIQLGAILAVVALYFQRLFGVLLAAPKDPQARRFILSVLIAFLPAVFVGLVLHDWIKTVLFESPRLICWSLIVGGVVLLAVDRWPPKARFGDAMRFPLLTSLGVGLFQCLSIVPGVSRSGSTIVGALLLGADRRSAAEFSFFLAIPTMVAAFAYDLFKSRDLITADGAGVIAVGFVVSFLSGLVVIKTMLGFVQKRGYGVFGWWRILVGVLGLVAMQMA